jgi:hypothetical protein
MEEIYKDAVTFNILGKEMDFFKTDKDSEYPNFVVIETDKKYYYLGAEEINIESALFAYQDFFNVVLTEKQIEEIVKSNQK